MPTPYYDHGGITIYHMQARIEALEYEIEKEKRAK